MCLTRALLLVVVLHLPKQQIFQKTMMRSEGGDAEAGQPVAPTAFEYKVANEGGRPYGHHFPRRRAPALLEQLARGERRITLADHAMMLRRIADRVVQQVAAQSFDARIRRHLHRLVYVCALPTSARPTIEA